MNLCGKNGQVYGSAQVRTVRKCFHIIILKERLYKLIHKAFFSPFCEKANIAAQS